jgi:hypothetical protein
MSDYYENPAKTRFRNAKVKPWDYLLSSEELALRQEVTSQAAIDTAEEFLET